MLNSLVFQIFILKNEDLLIKIYLKTHFIDSLLLTLRNALHGPSGVCYKDINVEAKVVVEDVTEILCYLVHQLVASEGNAPFTVRISSFSFSGFISCTEARYLQKKWVGNMVGRAVKKYILVFEFE